MIKVGMMIGDRYEILEKIGTGGMSDVYKAKCHKLNRLVAVKVLKQEFSENENFVSKFRTEAQAAAGLMHPNIVNVYDVGEENGVYYIVMELVDGITLKNYIEKKARISVKEAISIAIQISMGIEAAHNNHIIHRDIKPQNIIISKDGKVKVTDFGIAKAASSNTITSNVMGSVHYTSPEQARGGYSDEKSDIYSLGITMFEMLTGRVPFNGETTVAIAIKHIQEELPSPRDYVSEIPVSVEQIVFKCCQKSPDRRYQSIAELLEDLKKSLIMPDEDFVVMDQFDDQAETKFISDEERGRIIELHEDTEMPVKEKKSKNKKPIKPAKKSDLDDEFEYDDDKWGKITTVLGIVLVAAVFLVVLVLVGRATGKIGNKESASEAGTPVVVEETSKVDMIKVEGKNLKDAEDALHKMGLLTEVNYVESSAYDTNTVISSDIQAGQSIPQGTTIKLTVSLGMEGVTVPSVESRTYEEAENTLTKAGFKVIKSEKSSAAVEKGHVISQTPDAGTKAPNGSAVSIVVSSGAEDAKIRIPNFLGKSEEDATAMIYEAGLELGSVKYVESTEFANDEVCFQSISEGSYVDAGTKVDLQVCSGSRQATYSYSGNITGPTVSEDAGFKDGTQVNVTIVTADGTQLLSTRTTAFPIAVNYSGIKSSSGKLTFNYVVTSDPVTTTNPETGEVVTTPGTSEEKTITRTINFTKEGE